MPYITNERRLKIYDQDQGQVNLKEIKNAGELNYALTVLVHYHLLKNSEGRYQNMNDIMGALEGAKHEFYRRVVVPYEDKKIQEMGDVEI